MPNHGAGAGGKARRPAAVGARRPLTCCSAASTRVRAAVPFSGSPAPHQVACGRLACLQVTYGLYARVGSKDASLAGVSLPSPTAKPGANRFESQPAAPPLQRRTLPCGPATPPSDTRRFSTLQPCCGTRGTFAAAAPPRPPHFTPPSARRRHQTARYLHSAIGSLPPINSELGIRLHGCAQRVRLRPALANGAVPLLRWQQCDWRWWVVSGACKRGGATAALAAARLEGVGWCVGQARIERRLYADSLPVI